jgi:hypothetical protein
MVGRLLFIDDNLVAAVQASVPAFSSGRNASSSAAQLLPSLARP